MAKKSRKNRRKSWGFWDYAGIAAGGVALGAAAFVAAPAAAAALGATGLLGVAGTGAAISGLSGAAATSASLAAIGGSVAGGTFVLTGCGAAFGSTVIAINRSLENGNYKAAERKLRTLKKRNRREAEEFYVRNEAQMSPEMRTLWKKHFS